jgi:protoheme IX farnesyltransferase
LRPPITHEQYTKNVTPLVFNRVSAATYLQGRRRDDGRRLADRRSTRHTALLGAPRREGKMDYLRAAKPRVVGLFLFTVLAAMLLAGRPAAWLMAAVLISTGLTLAGASILNNHVERETDRRMERTRRRPTATGSLSPARALTAGLACVGIGAAALLATAGPLAAALAIAGAAYYVVVYTLLLKPRTSMSAVPGGLAGIFPPLVGWAASGASWSGGILFLCAVIYVWSPAHFWALAYARRDDYVLAGLPTPAESYGEKNACLYILVYVCALTALAVLPVAAGVYGSLYLALSLAAGVAFLALAVQLLLSRSRARAWTVYKFSGPYLAVVILAMLLDRLLQSYLPG